MFFKVDQWLLGLFERNSKALTRLTGKNNYFWARVVLFLSTVMIFLVVDASDYKLYSSFFIVVFSLLIAEIYWMERIALNKISSDDTNPPKRADDWFYLRIMAGLFLLLVPSLALLEMLSISYLGNPILIYNCWLYLGSLWIFIYLVSCDTEIATVPATSKSEND
ncbi:MAG: hypothetical protein WC473_05095 [Patescibacteria group bacterium]